MEFIITWAKCKFVPNWSHDMQDPRCVPPARVPWPKERCRNVQPGRPLCFSGKGCTTVQDRIVEPVNFIQQGTLIWWLIDWAACQIFRANSKLVFNSSYFLSVYKKKNKKNHYTTSIWGINFHSTANQTEKMLNGPENRERGDSWHDRDIWAAPLSSPASARDTVPGGRAGGRSRPYLIPRITSLLGWLQGPQATRGWCSL